jgi:hypothetical protein
MAKMRKPTKETQAQTVPATIDPKTVHELLQVHGPYEPTHMPPGWPDHGSPGCGAKRSWVPHRAVNPGRT